LIAKKSGPSDIIRNENVIEDVKKEDFINKTPFKNDYKKKVA
jgi:hypothetical protein